MREMREIKFRQYIGCTDNKFHLFGQVDGVWMAPCQFDYDKYPLEQYTGLKDKNGKDIYEGDIVDDQFDCGQLRRIYYSDSEACFKAEEFNTRIVRYENDPPRFCIPLSISPETTTLGKIIGNIHENPELIKQTT